VRPLVLVHLPPPFNTGPALVLTEQDRRLFLDNVTVAYTTSTRRGPHVSTELVVGPECGVHHECVISLDNVVTVPNTLVGTELGLFPTSREPELTRASSLRSTCVPPRGVRAQARELGGRGDRSGDVADPGVGGQVDGGETDRSEAVGRLRSRQPHLPCKLSVGSGTASGVARG